MYYIYILYSETIDRYYVGHTNDVGRRLKEHNNPKRYSKYTAKTTGWVLAASFPAGAIRSKAARIERYIKQQKSRKFIEAIVKVVEDPSALNLLIRVPTRRD